MKYLNHKGEVVDIHLFPELVVYRMGRVKQLRRGNVYWMAERL